MKKIIAIAVLGMMMGAVFTGCGSFGEDQKNQYAAGYDKTSGMVYETEIPEFQAEEQEDWDYETDYDLEDWYYEADYDSDEGWYNGDAGYFYGSKERHSILQDPNDYERGNSR